MNILSRKTDLYEIVGDNLEMLKVRIETVPVFAEAGKMVYMRGNVRMETRMGGKEKGLLGKIVSAGKRVLAGESLFLTYFEGSGEVGFAGDFPGRVLPVELSGETIFAQRDAFLAAAGDIEISVAFQKRIGGALFGGEGLIVEKISGRGVVFLHAGGDLVSFELSPGETLRVDTGCAVAWDETVDYDVELIRSVKSIFFGGEGFFLATMRGPGIAVVQTMPLSKLRAQLQAGGAREAPERSSAQAIGAGAVGAGLGAILGSVLGGEED